MPSGVYICRAAIPELDAAAVILCTIVGEGVAVKVFVPPVVELLLALSVPVTVVFPLRADVLETVSVPVMSVFP